MVTGLSNKTDCAFAMNSEKHSSCFTDRFRDTAMFGDFNGKKKKREKKKIF